MKHHTFLPINKDLLGQVIWRCDRCGSEFVYSGDLLYSNQFERSWKKRGIDEDCDMQLVKQAIKS